MKPNHSSHDVNAGRFSKNLQTLVVPEHSECCYGTCPDEYNNTDTNMNMDAFLFPNGLLVRMFASACNLLCCDRSKVCRSLLN